MNCSKTALLRALSVVSAIFGGVCGLATFSPPAAADIIIGPYENYISMTTCGRATICKIDFPSVLPNTRLDIRNASCFIKGIGGQFFGAKFPYQVGALQLIVILANGTYGPVVTLNPSITSTAPNAVDRTISSNDTLAFFAKAGQHIQVYLETSAANQTSQLACSIGGDLVQVNL